MSSIVIGAILLMILLANFLAARFSGLEFATLYACLGLALAFNYGFNFSALNALSWSLRLVISGAVVSSPLFFAALIFARAFALVESPSHALACNLFGSLIGGMLEYADMWTGLRALNVMALALYAVSALALYLQLRAGRRASPALAG